MNPFDKFFGKEDILQRQVATYLSYQYPHVFWFHTPNEGARTAFERYKAKCFGIKSGVPDVLIFQSKNDFKGCAIELKIKPNRLQPSQIVCLEMLKTSGWFTQVCWNFEETKKTIDDYLK